MRRSPLTAAVLAAALSLGVVACGSDSGNSGNGVQPGATATTCAPSSTNQAMGGDRPNDTLVNGGMPIAGGQAGGNGNTGPAANQDTSNGNPAGNNSATGPLPGPSSTTSGGGSGGRGIGNGTGSEAGALGTC